MLSLEHYLRHAQASCDEIRSQLTFGSNSEVDANRTDLKRFFALRIIQSLGVCLQDDVSSREEIALAYIQMSPWIIAKYGYGHCGEISRAGLINLINQGIYPITLCHTTQGEHSLILMGHAPNFDIQDRTTWGPKAVYCDIWANVVTPATGFLQAQQSKACKNVLKNADQPHHLSGRLCVDTSILTENSLREFQQKITISDAIRPLFAKTILSDEDLRSELPLLRKYYHILHSKGLNSIVLSELEKYFNELSFQLGRGAQSSIPFKLFKPLSPRPLNVRGWCVAPPGSFQDDEDRTIVPDNPRFTI